MLVKNRIFIRVHILAKRITSPQRFPYRGVVLQVVRPQRLLDVLTRFLRVIERHLTKDMMADVRVRDVVERMVEQPAEGAVDSAKSPAEP